MSDISKIKPNGTEYNLKDATARAGIESSKTLKSSVVTVTDAAPINAEDITVDITPQQDLHGYDRPWAGGGGKNKLPMTVAGIKAANRDGTWSGNTYTINNGTVEILVDSGNNVIGLKVNGTFSANTFFSLFGLQEYATNNYILTGINISHTQTELQLYYRDLTNSQDVNPRDSGEGATIRLQSGRQYTGYLRISYGYTASSKIIYPMIRLASETDATFAPYSNICPISGRSEVDLTRNNNLFDEEYPNLSTDVSYRAIKVGNGTFTMSSNAKGNSSFALLFFLAGNVSSGASSANNGVYDGHSVTVTTTDEYVTVAYRKTSVSTQTPIGSQTKIEKGSVATPYITKTYTIQFGQTVYGCTVDFNTGETVVDTGFVEFTGREEEDWARYTSGSASDFAMQVTISNFSGISSSPDKLSANYLQTIPASATWGSYDSWISAYGVANKIVTGIKSITTLESWKAYLESNPLQVCYELANPQTFHLTPAQLKMLKGTNTLTCNGATITLKYQPNNVVGELKGEIRAVEAELAEAEENLEIVYEDHVANTSMGIIVDGYSVGDMPFSNALDIAKTGYTPIAVTDTSIVHSTVANQGEIATHCLLDVTNNRVRFYVHVMDSAASLTIPPNSLTFRVAYKKA